MSESLQDLFSVSHDRHRCVERIDVSNAKAWPPYSATDGYRRCWLLKTFAPSDDVIGAVRQRHVTNRLPPQRRPLGNRESPESEPAALHVTTSPARPLDVVEDIATSEREGACESFGSYWSPLSSSAESAPSPQRNPRAARAARSSSEASRWHCPQTSTSSTSTRW